MNNLKTTLLLGALTGLLLVGGQAMAGNTGMVIGMAIAIVMNFGSYWYSDKLVLKMYGAQPATAEQAPVLHSIVRELSVRAGLPMPRVYLMQDPTPNAFATGRNPENAAVAATTGLLNVMARDEIAGVMAHELAHVEHRDTLIGAISATFAGAIAMLANFAQFAMIFGMGRRNEGGNPFAAILMMIIAPMAAGLIQMAISRSREYAADARGAAICGHPLWLSSALRKLATASKRTPMHTADAHLFIVNPLTVKNLSQLFSTHPPVEERIRRLEAAAQGNPKK